MTQEDAFPVLVKDGTPDEYIYPSGGRGGRTQVGVPAVHGG